MTSRGLARAAGGIAIATVIAVSGVVAWSLLHRPVLDAAVPLPEGPRLGDMTGYVGRVDSAAQTIAIAEDPGGARLVEFRVTADTAIRIRGQGASFSDLSRDMRARAYYEVRGEVKYLTSLEVPDDGRAAAQRPVAEATADKQAPAAAPPSPPAVAAAETARIAPGTRPSPTSDAGRPHPTTAPATERARRVSPHAPDAPGADTEANDGTAAIDWLLEQSRRR